MRKSAIDRLTTTIANGRLTLELASRARLELSLPDPSDLAAIDALRTAIKSFGQKNDLTRGQINAALKTLTVHGYYVAGPKPTKERARWAIKQLSEEQRRKLCE